MRTEPSSKSRIMSRAANGDIVYSHGEKGEWLHITWDASPHSPVAYIHRSQVKKLK